MPKAGTTIDVSEILDAISRVSNHVTKLEVEVNEMHQEKMQKMADIEKQVKYTNGRVRGLELEEEKRRAVADYIASHEAKPQVSVQTTTVTQIDWQKIVLAIVGVLSLALTILATVKGVSIK
jgi:hypothetical protein